MGDRLWTGKPPRRRTRHPGLLSLSPPSVVRLEWVPSESRGSKHAYRVIHQYIAHGLAVFAAAKAGEVNRHIAWYTSISYMVLQCSLNARLKELASGDQRRLMGSGSALEACSRRNATQIHIYFTFTLHGQSAMWPRHRPLSCWASDAMMSRLEAGIPRRWAAGYAVLDLRLESQGVETCCCDWDSEEFSLHVASLASLQVDYQALWMRPTEPKTRSNW